MKIIRRHFFRSAIAAVASVIGFAGKDIWAKPKRRIFYATKPIIVQKINNSAIIYGKHSIGFTCNWKIK